MVSGQPNEFKTKTTATKIESNKNKKFNYESKTVKVREHKERETQTRNKYDMISQQNEQIQIDKHLIIDDNKKRTNAKKTLINERVERVDIQIVEHTHIIQQRIEYESN